MSVSKWAYIPERCDGEPCPGDCNTCSKAKDGLSVFEAVKLLEELRDSYGWGDVIIHSDDAEALTMATEALKRDRWIPCEERLPEPTWGRVLVYTDEREIMTLPACKVGNGYVTHWKAVETPKEET